jgi:amino acid adenylation domain-containing protein
MFSYGDIAGIAASWARDLRSEIPPRSQFQIVAIIAPSSPVAYIGSLAAQIADSIFVPIDPVLPAEVINRRLRDIRPSCIALDARCKGLLAELDDQGLPVMIWDEHRAGSAGTLRLPPGRPAGLVYILATSGSTGPAKLTPIRAVGAWQAVAQVRARLGIGPGDRLIQTFPVGFDLSILSAYLAWTSGAALVLPAQPDLPEGILLTGSAESCTVWFSVPSLVRLVPESASLPAVRHSLFCGEALYASDVAKWRGIARHSTVHNLYGPTECAMVATHYQCPDAPGPAGAADPAIVPIGWPLPGVDAEVAEVAGRAGGGGQGELLLGGRQMMPGYWRQPAETRRSMVLSADRRRRMYRTGDLVTRDASGLLHFVGRLDDQVKVMGHRIELQEVTLALSAIDGVSEAVAFTVTDDATRCERLVAAYTSHTGVNPAEVRGLLLTRLPRWMVPWPIIKAGALPRNSSGKTSAAMLRRQFVSGGIS